MGLVYGIKRKQDDKIIYVGQTITSINKRWSKHKQDSKDLDRKYPFANALRKYGVNNFYPCLLEECEDNELNERECYWIKELHTLIDEEGYNATSDGDTPSKLVCIPVYQYILKGKFIKEYPSISEAQKAISRSGNCISKAANGLLQSAYGFRWSFKKVEQLDNKNYFSYRKAIAQYDLDDNLIKVYSSATEAAKELHIKNGNVNISAVANGKRNTAYGYKWEFIKEV